MAMIRKHHVKEAIKWLAWLYIVSLVIFSIFGAWYGLLGNKVSFNKKPTQTFEEVSFPSQASDGLQLSGWFLPANTQLVATIVHGWGGHRARLLPLAEFLQRNNINVLTFDLRGGTGRNTYGYRESGDLAGAIQFLTTSKHFAEQKISIIGVSMGGAAAVDYVSKQPIDKLILVSPIIDIAHAKYTALRDRHFIFPSIYANGATVVEWLFFGVHPLNPIKIFDKVTSPTLILHGTADKLSPVKDVYRLQSLIQKRNQQNVKFIIIPGAQHTFFDQDEANGFPYSQAILEFIQK